MIEGVQIVPLRVIPDERGDVRHMLRADAPHFAGFGEVYFSTVNEGAVKGWKRHRRMTLNLAAPVGRVRLTLFDERPDSPTMGQIQDVVIGREAYDLVVVPPGVWMAFQGLAAPFSLLANCASIPHDPDEADVRPLSDPPALVAW